MYQLSIFNNQVETVIHYPSNNQEDPHVNSLSLKDSLSVVDTVSFTLYSNNNGYDRVFELTTKVKIIDLRDNSIRFIGRVLDTNNKMDSNGSVYKEVSCEGAISYLNDTKLRGTTIHGNTVSEFLTQILNIHNSKVEADKRIHIGNVDIPGNATHTCEFKTTFAELVATREIIGGHIRVRETNGLLYMDWLQSFSNNILEVSLGVNMKDMVIGKDVTSLGTRIIPLGANNITIEPTNGGLDYLEDIDAKNAYGVIEKVVEYRDIENPSELRNICLKDLSSYTQPSFVLTSNALDLSYITGNKVEQFVLGLKIHLMNRFMRVDDIYSIVSIDLDLLKPYDPKLILSKKPITLSNSINDLRKTSIQNNGVYNNVQIGSAYGIRVTRSDNKVVTTMNATDGISIQNNSKKVFYVDIDGNIVVNDITANGGTYHKIKVTDIVAEGGKFEDIKITGGLNVEDGDASCEINSKGIKLVSDTGDEANIQIIDDDENHGVYIPDDLYVKDYFKVGRAANFETEDVFIDGVSLQDYIINIAESTITRQVKEESLN